MQFVYAFSVQSLIINDGNVVQYYGFSFFYFCMTHISGPITSTLVWHSTRANNW